MFLDILSKRIDYRKRVVLIANTLELNTKGKTMRWLESHPRFHLITALESSQWPGASREFLGSVGEWNKRTIALQLENLIVSLKEFRNGPHWKLGVFASVPPQR